MKPNSIHSASHPAPVIENGSDEGDGAGFSNDKTETGTQESWWVWWDKI